MLKPVTDRIFIRIEKSTATSGGIILPNDEHYPSNIGVVESIGSCVTSVKTGDKILFHIFDELPSLSPDIVVIRENSILGVFENE